MGKEDVDESRFGFGLMSRSAISHKYDANGIATHPAN
jgi:hypothetical protein